MQRNKILLFTILYCTLNIAYADDTPAPTAMTTTQMVISRNDITQLVITEDDLNTIMMTIPENYRTEIIADISKLKQIIDNLVLAKNVAFDARKHQFDQRPDIQSQLQWEMDKKLATLYLQAKEKEKRNEISPQNDNLLQLAQEQYEVLKANGKMKTPEMIRVSHILINTNQADGTTAQAFAQKLYEQIKAGANFEALAKTYSEDTGSKDKGGDLGYFPSNKMVPEFEAAAFALNAENPLSEPIRTQFGYHIIKFTDRKPAVDKTFEEVKKELIDKILTKYANEARAQYTSSILSPDIKIFAEAIQAYQAKYAPHAIKPPITPAPSQPATNNPQN